MVVTEERSVSEQSTNNLLPRAKEDSRSLVRRIDGQVDQQSIQAQHGVLPAWLSVLSSLARTTEVAEAETTEEAFAPPALNRQVCGEIRGTKYLSDEEREWYLEHCKPQRSIYPAANTTLTAGTGDVVADFIAGWQAGGGAEHLLARALATIQCESGWNLYAYSAAGPYVGLGQWDSTWWVYGGGDIFSAWQQGHNMALRVMRNQGDFGAWPVCGKKG